MNRNVTLFVVLAILAVLLVANVDWGNKPHGVTPPGPVLRNDKEILGYLTGEEKVQVYTRNLSFEKENRTLAAAQNLGKMGAQAQNAIPRLEELIAAEPDSNDFPSERQKEAYRDALAKIKTAVTEEKGVSAAGK